MSLSLKQRNGCEQMSDAAELERQAALDRMAEQEWVEEDGAMRMLGMAIIACIVIVTVGLLLAMPTIVRWMAGAS